MTLRRFGWISGQLHFSLIEGEDGSRSFFITYKLSPQEDGFHYVVYYCHIGTVTGVFFREWSGDIGIPGQNKPPKTKINKQTNLCILD